MIDLPREAQLRESIELFYFAYRAFTDRPDRILEKRGLGRVHHRIVYFVGRNPGITVNELLGILRVTKQALNPPLRQLIAMRLIATQTPDHDRRFRQLRLTTDGQRLEAQLTGAQLALLDAAFRAVGEDGEHGWQAIMRLISATERS